MKNQVTLDIRQLIRYLERAIEMGAQSVTLEGNATLHAEGIVLMATEPQI